MGIFSGPMFEPKKSKYQESIFDKQGAHCNIYSLDEKLGMELLKNSFPDGKATAYSFVLFSTSGVHGTYATIEDIEFSLKKYGTDEKYSEENDYHDNHLTVLIINPRTVTMRYGHIEVSLEDIPFLHSLRESSKEAIKDIGEYWS